MLRPSSVLASFGLVCVAFGCSSKGTSDAPSSPTSCIVRPAGAPALASWPDDPTMLHPGPAPAGDFAPSSHAPFAPMPNHGYVPPSKLRLEVITTPSDPHASSIGDFANALASSAWWKSVGADYGVPPAFDQVLVTTGPEIHGTLDDKGIDAYIHDASRAAPDAADRSALTIRLVFLPPGASYATGDGVNCDCVALGGAHWRSAFGQVVGFVQRCPAAVDGVLDSVTRIASHEIIEAATDPVGYGLDGYYFSTDGLQPGVTPLLAFQSIESRYEVGDACNTTAYEGPWAFIRVWSNSKAITGAPPCVPYVSSEPYFNVTSDAPWYSFSSSRSIDVPLHGWSETARADWYVTLSSYYPAATKMTASLTGARSEALGTHAYHAINNGDDATLTIDAGDAKSGDYVVITLASRSVEPSTSHAWRVGAYLP